MSMKTTHRHHIVPRHAGGTNDPSNLVELTIPEHAEAHRLLWEQYGRVQDKLAWLMLSGKREEAEQARLELLRSPEFRETMSKAMTGLTRTAEHCANISKSLRGKSPSAETRAKMAAAKRGRRGNNTGHTHSDEAKRKMSESRRKRTDITQDAKGRWVAVHKP